MIAVTSVCHIRPNDFSETAQNSQPWNLERITRHFGWDVMIDTREQYARDDVAALKAHIEELKQAIVLLQAQLADIREQRDRWQSRAERISLVSVC
jgi:uncharacterized protein with von Willebrand factor type A (vWA) domain